MERTHTTKWFSTLYGFGMLASAAGLILLLVALVPLVNGDGHLVRATAFGGTGAVVTIAGFAAMNAGAVRNGYGFRSIDPVHYEEHPDDGNADARQAIAEARRSPENATELRCIACGNDNRASARYCDQCGERL